MQYSLDKLTSINTQVRTESHQSKECSTACQENEKQDNSVAIKTGYLERLIWWQWWQWSGATCFTVNTAAGSVTLKHIHRLNSHQGSQEDNRVKLMVKLKNTYICAHIAWSNLAIHRCKWSRWRVWRMVCHLEWHIRIAVHVSHKCEPSTMIRDREYREAGPFKNKIQIKKSCQKTVPHWSAQRWAPWTTHKVQSSLPCWWYKHAWTRIINALNRFLGYIHIQAFNWFNRFIPWN